MRNFKTRPAAFLSSFRLLPIIKLKNLSAVVITTRRTTTILLRKFERKVFCAPKLPDLSIPHAERIDAAQVCRRRGIVSEYLVTVDRGLRAEPPAAEQFCSKK